MATIQSFVNGLYTVMYGRVADSTGYNYWLGQVGATAASATTTQITDAQAQALATQFQATQATYFTGQYGALSDAQFISALYTNLGGNATVAGADLVYWQTKLATFGGNRAQLAGQFTQEFLNYSGTDANALARQAAFNNKVAVSIQWVTTSASNPFMNSAGTSDAAFAAEMKILSGINSDSSTRTNAIAQISSAATAGNLTPVVGQTSTFSQTVTLTAGVDAPGTGAFATTSLGSNSIVYGVFNGAAGTNTYTTGDNISAPTGATNVTLNITDGGAAGTGNLSGVAATVSGVTALVVNSPEAVTVNTATGFAGLATSTVTSAATGANGDTVTAAGTTAIAVTDAATAATGALTINGGSTVVLTETDTDNGTAALLSNVSIGQTTKSLGNVTATVTDTYTFAGAAPDNITVSAGGTVTVTSTVNDGLALAANTSTAGTQVAQAANTAGSILVKSAVGAVVVNDALNVTSLTTIATNADEVTVLGGSSVTVNETVTAIQTATGVSTVTEGAVFVTGDATTTTVTVNQAAVAAGKIVTAAVAAVAPVNQVKVVAAGPGANGVTAVSQVTAAAAVSAVATGTSTITADGAVTIVDKNGASATLANTITSVSLNSYGNSSITDSALATLSLSGTGGTLAITNNNTAATTAAASTLALSVNGLSNTGAAGTNNSITDTNNEISILNITTGATASSILAAASLATTAFTDTGLKTVNISGSSVLTMGAWGTAPTAITVTGAAGYTGFITDTTTVFNASGATGKDTIGIGATPTKAVTGGSGTTDEIVVNAANVADTGTSTANYAKFNSNITGFEVFGITNAVTGLTWDMSKLTAAYTGIAIEDGTAWSAAATTSATFTNVATGATLALNGAVGTVSLSAVDVTGATDSIAITQSGNVTSLTVADANGIGFGTISVANTGNNTIGTLVDTALTSLTLSGSGSETVTTFTSDLATQLTLTNNSTFVPASIAQTTAGIADAINGALTITTLTDNNLGSLTFAGSDATVITTLNDTVANLTITSTDTSAVQIGTLAGGTLGSLKFAGTGNVDVRILTETAVNTTIANNGTGTVSVGDGAAGGFADAALKSLTLTGNVAFGTNTGAAVTATGATTGVTVAAGTDNAHISINLTGAAAASTDTITVGNGNDLIKDGSTAGVVNVTAGTGYNLVDVSSGAAGTFSANVTFGAHTSTSTLFDQVNVSTQGAAAVSVPNTVITGAVTGDHISIAAATSLVTLTSAQLSQAASYATIGAAVGYVDGAGVGLAANAATAFVWQGNTYVLETVAGGAADTGTMAAGNTLVQIIGSHTFATALSGTHMVLAS